jgi:hypothetical protein
MGSPLRSNERGPRRWTLLADKVAEAQASLAAGNLGDTCGTMGAFINEVRAQLSGTQAQQLVADATRIRAVLGCN